MNHLQDTFDQLPQDFDRMAIWRGIEKPTRRFWLPHLFWTDLAVLCLIGLVWGIAAWMPSTPPGTSPHAPKQPLAAQAPRSQPVAAEAPPGIAHAPAGQIPAPRPQAAPPQTGRAIQAASPLPLPRALAAQLHPIPAGGIPTPLIREIPPQAVPAMAPTVQAPAPAPRFDPLPAPAPVFRNSLHLRLSAGQHRAVFSPAQPATLTWRAPFEQAQVDFGLGLRYERVLQRDFLLAFSAQYTLFKDNIQTTRLGTQLGQPVRIAYDLHNHYHVFAAQLALGKRMPAGPYFWDVLGGGGVKLYQVSEVDFFVGEGQLASEAQAQALYAPSPDLFFTAQTAVGRHLGHRLTIRLGAQAASGLDLSAATAPYQHRVLSLNAFVEAGWRF